MAPAKGDFARLSVRLLPVDYSHLDQLFRWSTEEEIWRYMTFVHFAERRYRLGLEAR
jgi:hypothetical protein